MKRTEMKRSAKPMARTSTLLAKPAKEAKPAKGPREKKCANRACRAPYLPDLKQPWKNWCGDDCALVIALEKLAKQKASKAKAERAADKKRKEEGMPHKDRLEAVQKLANRVAVLRDWHDGCISCDKPAHWNGVWHGSHYKSVGSNSALRYNMLNISKACSDCNWHRGGNIANYVPRLRLKIGQDRVEWLDNHPRTRVYTTEYLIRFAAIARRWIKRKEKRLGIKR